METLISPRLLANIRQYYAEAGPDYEYWSTALHMHFGLARKRQFWNREKMLAELCDEVLRRLSISHPNGAIADFGCGVGASMRRAASSYKSLQVKGITIVPWQKEKADTLNIVFGLEDRLEVSVEDYHRTSLASESMDGVYAIESACYSPEELQDTLFKEIYRVLKPGSRLVISDGFLKSAPETFSPVVRNFYESICRNWALPGLMDINSVKEKLRNAGFRKLTVEEVSWRVAPSVIHVPFVIARFLIAKTIQRKKLSEQSIRNLKGSFQTLLLGLSRRNFGYFIVTAEKSSL
jgi:MPBQ/MSBQ methyltransferase